MSDHERRKWDSRYAQRGAAELAEPIPWLSQQHSSLPVTGRALDVAGGDGRNGLWLAARGLQVTIVDISTTGLQRARAHAAARGVDIETVLADFEREPLPPGPWDLILDVDFLLRPLFSSMVAALAPGGVLLVCHPTRTNLQRHSKPGPGHLLHDGELGRIMRPLPVRIERYEEDWSARGRHDARLLARRTTGHVVAKFRA